MNLTDTILEFWPRLLDGTLITLTLTGLATLFGIAASLPLAIVRLTGNGSARRLVQVYISFFRGTPVLAQLFLLYYGSGAFSSELKTLGLWWIFQEPFNCAILTFTLNTTAYQTEIIRGGIQAVDAGEIEAGKAFGMGRATIYRRVILPHAYRIAFPALGNEIILLLKSGAVASVITIFDLMGETKAVFAITFDFAVYIWAAVIYLMITSVFVHSWRFAERLLNPQLQPPPTV